MTQPIQVSVIQSYCNFLVPQYYRTTIGSLTYLLELPTAYKTASTQVFVNQVYQAFSSYYETSGNTSLYFPRGIPPSSIVEVRYNLFGT